MPDLPIHLFWLIFFAYIIVVSLCSIVVCIYDKKISKRNNVKLRIPEKSLFIWSAVGGSAHLLPHFPVRGRGLAAWRKL